MMNNLFESLKQVSKHVKAATGMNKDELPVQTFKRLWEAVQTEHRELIETGGSRLDDPQLLAKTRIPHNLDLMICMLNEEDRGMVVDSNASLEGNSVSTGSRRSGAMRACLEFTLEHRVLDGLYALASMDTPLGMTILVIKVFKGILEQVRHPLVPYKNAHRPIRQLVHLVSEVGNQSTKLELLLMLERVWSQIREDASRVLAFFEVRSGKDQLDIFSALLPFVCENSRAGEAARRSILIVSNIGESSLQKYTAESNLVEALAAKLASIVDDIVRQGQDTEANRNFLVELWCFCCAISTPIFRILPFETEFNPTEDTLAEFALLSNALVQAVDRDFFVKCLSRNVLETSEIISTNTLSIISVLLEQFEGQEIQNPLCWSLVKCLINVSYLSAEGSVGDTALQKFILHSIDSMSELVSRHAMRLFAVLLGFNDPRILHCLVLQYLYKGTHLTEESAIRNIPNSDPMVTPTKVTPHRSRKASGSVVVNFLQSFPQSPRPPRPDNSRNLSLQEEKDLYSFESYLTDRQGGAAAKIAVYASPGSKVYTRMTSPAPKTRKRLSLPQEIEFEEGPFLSGVLNKLERFLENSMHENLRLTQVLSILAESPHVVLRSFVFDEEITMDEFQEALCGSIAAESSKVQASSGDAMLILRRNVRNVSNIVSKVWAEALDRASDMAPYFENHRQAVRQALGVDGVRRTSGDAHLEQLYTESRQRFVQSYVILEEFLKELASILHAKQTLLLFQKKMLPQEEEDEETLTMKQDDDEI